MSCLRERPWSHGLPLGGAAMRSSALERYRQGAIIEGLPLSSRSVDHNAEGARGGALLCTCTRVKHGYGGGKTCAAKQKPQALARGSSSSSGSCSLLLALACAACVVDGLDLFGGVRHAGVGTQFSSNSNPFLAGHGITHLAVSVSAMRKDMNPHEPGKMVAARFRDGHAAPSSYSARRMTPCSASNAVALKRYRRGAVEN